MAHSPLKPGGTSTVPGRCFTEEMPPLQDEEEAADGEVFALRIFIALEEFQSQLKGKDTGIVNWWLASAQE